MYILSCEFRLWRPLYIVKILKCSGNIKLLIQNRNIIHFYLILNQNMENKPKMEYVYGTTLLTLH